jgi:signal transduction histidine kinase
MTSHVSARRNHEIAGWRGGAALSLTARPRLNAGGGSREPAPVDIAEVLTGADGSPKPARIADEPSKTMRERRRDLALLAAGLARSQSIGVALLTRDRIVIRNARFGEIMRSSLGAARWIVTSPGSARGERIRGAGLAGLVTRLGARLSGVAARAYADVRVARAGDDRVWRLRLEGGGATKARHGTVLAILDDVTAIARTEAELARARHGLRRRETLLAMGEIAAGVAHDLGNTLGALQVRAALIAREPDLTAAQRVHLEWVRSGLRDSLAMLTRVQESLRGGARERPARPVELAVVVRHAVELAETSFTERPSKRVEILVQLPPLPPVWGISAELRQMFVNLLLNARDAMPRGGSIRICGQVSNSAGRRRVVIKVEDEGSGVPPAIRHRIFDPFFTTKGEDGTGIGLSMARDLMIRIGGRISVANRPRGGAVFTMRFLPADTVARASFDGRRAARAVAAAYASGVGGQISADLLS